MSSARAAGLDVIQRLHDLRVQYDIGEQVARRPEYSRPRGGSGKSTSVETFLDHQPPSEWQQCSVALLAAGAAIDARAADDQLDATLYLRETLAALGLDGLRGRGPGAVGKVYRGQS